MTLMLYLFNIILWKYNNFKIFIVKKYKIFEIILNFYENLIVKNITINLKFLYTKNKL